MKVSLTALALLVTPLTLQAQDKAAEASQGTQEELNVDAADHQAPGTTKTTDEASTGNGSGQKVASASQPATPLVPSAATWDSFHGQLNAQKYSPLKQITSENVGKLKKVWEFHTGDVSDGKGDTPATVWSATPIFANETIYIGTPFDRLIALDPGTGKEKWHYDTKSSRKALTQPVLKNRGVSYWQAPLMASSMRWMPIQESHVATLRTRASWISISGTRLTPNIRCPFFSRQR